MSQSGSLALTQNSSKPPGNHSNVKTQETQLTKIDIDKIQEKLKLLNKIYGEEQKNSTVKIEELQEKLTKIETNSSRNQSGIPTWFPVIVSVAAAIGALISGFSTLFIGNRQVKQMEAQTNSIIVAMQTEVQMKKWDSFNSDYLIELRQRLATSLLAIIDQPIDRSIDKDKKILVSSLEKIKSDYADQPKELISEALALLEKTLDEDSSDERTEKIIEPAYKLMDFFTDIGQKEKIKALELKSIYTDYSYWVFGYYPLFFKIINRYINKDDNDPVYDPYSAKDFRDLYNEFVKIDNDEYDGTRRGHKDEEDIQRNKRNPKNFLKYEAKINSF